MVLKQNSENKNKTIFSQNNPFFKLKIAFFSNKLLLLIFFLEELRFYELAIIIVLDGDGKDSF